MAHGNTGPAANANANPFVVLALDGGGTKGAYTLGVLAVVEQLLGERISERFDLIYGTSTGAVIASMLALGNDIATVWDRYLLLGPKVMRKRRAATRSAALRQLAAQIYGDEGFDAFHTRVGIVATNVQSNEPLIFKSHEDMLHRGSPDFRPGFGCTIAEAVVASCSAHPFFQEVRVDFGHMGEKVLIDGGHVANNPTPLALLDAVRPLLVPEARVRALSVGTGRFPKKRGLRQWIVNRSGTGRRFLELLESSTKTMEWLNGVLFRSVRTVRIDEAHTDDAYRTSFLEADPNMLRTIYSLGAEDAERALGDLETLLSAQATT